MLNRQICNFSFISFLTGVKRGDRIAIYMPMTPEIVVAMLACARIGAMHSIVVSFFKLEGVIQCGALYYDSDLMLSQAKLG